MTTFDLPENALFVYQNQRGKTSDSWAKKRVKELVKKGVKATAKRVNPSESLCVVYSA